MKKIMFSALAVACAIAGVTASKASSSRTSNIFHFKKALSKAPTPATLTNTANWSTVVTAPSCTAGTTVPCSVTPPSADNIQTVTDLTDAIRNNGGVIPYTTVKKPINTL